MPIFHIFHYHFHSFLELDGSIHKYPAFTTIPENTCLDCPQLSEVEINGNVTLISDVNAFDNTPFTNSASLIDPTLYTNSTSTYAYGYFDTNYRGNIQIGASCFNHDTKILCLNKQLEEEYIPIQYLRKGDIVKTYLHGYRRIDMIGKGKLINGGTWNNCMYKMEKTDENELIEGLIVTGGHGILVDELSEKEEQLHFNINFHKKIDDKKLLLAGKADKFNKIVDSYY